ncbi:MAG: YybH family protein, partial [Bryobacteraceae bacterium]
RSKARHSKHLFGREHGLLPRSRPPLDCIPCRGFQPCYLSFAVREGGIMAEKISFTSIRQFCGGARSILNARLRPKPARPQAILFLAVAALLIGGIPASAQKNKKNQPPPAADSQSSAVSLPDGAAIDKAISEMLAAWELGDVDRMHQYYADDVLVVSGAWEPPITGWENYRAAYQAQRARMQSVRLDRTNTFTKVSGDHAWVTYQFEFNGKVDGNAASAHGHTTLVMEKRNGKWLIILNHTSLVQEGPAAPAAKSGTP